MPERREAVLLLRELDSSSWWDRWKARPLKAESRVFTLGDRVRIQVLAGPEAGKCLLEGLPDLVARESGIAVTRTRVLRLAYSPGRSISCFLGTDSASLFVARIPLDGRSLARCEENQRVLQELNDSGDRMKALGAFLPRPVGRIEIDGLPVFVETALPGSPPTRSPSASRMRALRRQAVSFLTRLHGEPRGEVPLDEESFGDRVGHYCDRACAALARTPDADAVLRLQEQLRKRMVGKRWPVVPEHGDFHLANCLFETGTGRLTGVVDWDLGASRGFPMLDLLHLLVTSEGSRRLDERTPAMLLQGGLSSDARERVTEYLSSVGLEAQALDTFVRIYCLVKILGTFLVREGASRERWRTEMVRPALATLTGGA